MKPWFVLLLSTLFITTLSAEGIEFFHGTWEEALAEAEAQDKLIFVDAFAVWCGPCKRMANNVFPQEEVGVFYNRNFINMKIDMEAPENEAFRREYPVAAFPTLFFIDNKGEIVHQTKGAKDVDGLIRVGKVALNAAEPVADFAEAYESGDRDPQLIYKYVQSLIRSGEPHLQITNEYLRSQTDLNTEQNLRFLLLTATEADSRVFDMFAKRKDAIVSLTSEAMFTSQVEAACKATVNKAVEYSMESLLEEAIEKMETYSPKKAQRFALKSSMRYAKAHNDAKAFTKAAKAFAKDVISDDANKLQDLALELANEFEEDSRALSTAEDIIQQAIDVGEGYRLHYSLAIILKKQAKYKEARAAAQQSLMLAKEEQPRAVGMLEDFIERLSNQG